ncbi:hypothetical protein D5086_021195 [Populus alba]|uniref:Uncharacterized protein n=1 Tax=Populus alba TaxID=43335 RepID=A0ACC4BC23_POPAL
MGCFYDSAQKDPSVVEVNGVWCGGSSSFGVVVVMDSATNAVAAARVKLPRSSSRFSHVTPIHCGLRELRNRINSVKNTQKITEAMKLVSAAKVRRAQEAVVNGRPFSETLVEVLYYINEQLQTEDIDMPLTNIRPVKKVALVVITGDRGLCGGFNNNIIKIAEARIAELKNQGVEYTVISVGKKDGDEFFRLTTKEGKLAVERDVVRTETAELSPILQFEQDPVQILDALLPLYMNSQILKALQESLASELAARMCAMSNATDNAVELKKSLSIIYNRERQAKITGEALEIIAGADALT